MVVLSLMIAQRLKIAILIYLWAALLEDTSLFLIAWLVPDLWFRLLHGTAPAGFDIAFLRRSAWQWAAFALAQHCTRVLEEETNLARHRRRSAFFRLVH